MKPQKTKILPTLAAAITGVFALIAGAVAVPAAPEPVKLRVELDRTVLPADTKEKVIVKIALDGIRPEKSSQRPPVNLAVVLDRSGSMSGDKIINAKAAAIEALNRLAADDIFSLVVFDDKIETLIPATRVGTGEALEARIRRLRPGGSTALFGGVSQGASEIRKNLENPRYVHRIILLSDGQANVGPKTPAELGRLGAALVKEGVSVTTIGLGLDYDEDLMTRLALRSDGNTYFVEGAPDLTRIFNAELGDVLSVVARRVVVTVEFPAGVKPLRFVGREGTINEQTAEFSLNQIYGGQEKFALIEAEVPANRAGGETEIASAKVAFENPVTQMPVNLTASQNARFSADAGAVKESANQQVLTDYGYNITALAREEAIARNDKGDYAGASKVMADNAGRLRTMGRVYVNNDLTNIAAANTQEAQIMNAGKLDNGLRKGYNMTNIASVSQQTNTVSVGYVNSFNGNLATNTYTRNDATLGIPGSNKAVSTNNYYETENSKGGVNWYSDHIGESNIFSDNLAGNTKMRLSTGNPLDMNSYIGFPSDENGAFIINNSSSLPHDRALNTNFSFDETTNKNLNQDITTTGEIKSLKVLEKWFIFADRGDTLETIAAKNKIGVATLRTLNPGTDWKNIRESQLIRVRK